MYLSKARKRMIVFIACLTLSICNVTYAVDPAEDVLASSGQSLVQNDNQSETIPLKVNEVTTNDNQIKAVDELEAVTKGIEKSAHELEITDGIINLDEQADTTDGIIKLNEETESTTQSGVDTDETTPSAIGVDFINCNTTVSNTLGTDYKGYLYKFTLDTPHKLAVLVNSDETLDVDAYIYNKDFEIIAASETEGMGKEEVINYMAEPGEYYIYVNDFEGKGTYLVEFFASNQDISYEMNDTLSAATPVNGTFEVTGMIDNPYDMDIYKTTVEKTKHMVVDLANNADVEYSVYLTQTGENFSKVTPDEAVILTPGDWYFCVFSEKAEYDLVNTYTLSTKAVKDEKYESNDELNASYKVSNNFTVSGVIDCTKDIDIYQMNLSKATHVALNFYNQGSDYIVKLTQDGTTFYDFTSEEDILALPAGNWYFFVSSPSNAYSLKDMYILSANIVFDSKYEPNDNLGQAYSVANDFSVSGVIDCVNDVDVYKTQFLYPDEAAIDFVDNSGNGYCLYATLDGENFYDLTAAKTVKFPAGTWYFYVFSPDDKYDLNGTYTLNCKIVSKRATNIKITGYSPEDTFMGCYRFSTNGSITVSGKVTADGTPLAGKLITLTWWNPVWANYTGKNSLGTSQASGYTNAAGEFSIVLNPAGYVLGKAGSYPGYAYKHDYDYCYITAEVIDGSGVSTKEKVLYYSSY